MQNIWAQIQSILEKRLAPGQCKVWISALTPIWEGDTFVLQAGSRFIADFVSARFTAAITEAVNQATGRKSPVRVVVASPKPLANETSMTCSDRSPSPAPDVPMTASAQKEYAGPASVRTPDPVQAGARAREHSSIAVPSFVPQVHVTEREALPADTRPQPRSLSSVQLFLPMPVKESTDARSEEAHAWRYTFDDFVVGPSNEFAHAASRSMCGSGNGADVLFLSSAPGLGKTHLLQAVGKTLCEKCNRRTPKVEYLTAEEFTTRFWLSLKAKDAESFKARYRDVDLLLLEDVHFLQGKEGMQMELLGTLKALQNRGSKVVLTSSFSPKDLQNMDEQLSSRLCGGLVSFIERPDQETRKRIFRHKARLHQVLLPEDVEDVLVQYIHADVRQIESCLQNLAFKARMFNGGAITMQMAWDIIGNYAVQNPVLDLDAIIAYVCQGFNLSTEQLLSNRRKQEYVSARNTAFYLARKHTDLSLESIGQRFNRRHSTVLKGITNLEREMSRQTPLGRQITSTLAMIERNGNIAVPPAR